MAREVIVRMLDDFDHTKVADEAIEFVFEGVTYTIDLTAENAAEFRAVMEPWTSAAHDKTKTKRTRAPESPAPSKKGNGTVKGETKEDRAKIRAWAKRKKVPLPARGIIPKKVRAAYEAAHSGPVLDEIFGDHTVPPLRDWARQQGHPLPKGGYVSARVRKLYEQTYAPALNGAGVR